MPAAALNLDDQGTKRPIRTFFTHSYEEVARVLGVPVGTVRSRLSAARAQFRVLWLRVEQETNHV